MRWLKKWSFVIILMIAGIFYYKADENLLKTTQQESMESEEEKPSETWQQLHGKDVPEFAQGDDFPEESLTGVSADGDTELTLIHISRSRRRR